MPTGREDLFPKTAWSLVIAARDANHPQYHEKLGELIDLYWKPVYLWIRCARAGSSQEAEDLTQGFFADFLEHELVAVASPDKGRFRAFLKMALRSFLIDQHRYASAQKRGGELRRIMFDEMAEKEAGALSARMATPEEAFDQSWKETVLSQVVTACKDTLERSGKEKYFEMFRRIVLEPPPEGPPTYEQVAREFSVSATDVANRLSYVKRLMHIELRQQVQTYVGSADDLEQEIRELFGPAS